MKLNTHYASFLSLPRQSTSYGSSSPGRCDTRKKENQLPVNSRMKRTSWEEEQSSLFNGAVRRRRAWDNSLKVRRECSHS